MTTEPNNEAQFNVTRGAEPSEIGPCTVIVFGAGKANKKTRVKVLYRQSFDDGTAAAAWSDEMKNEGRRRYGYEMVSSLYFPLGKDPAPFETEAYIERYLRRMAGM